MKTVFVSEIQDPYSKGSSTQIMTRNLLYGLREIAEKLDFIALYDRDCDIENVIKYYQKYADSIIPVPSRLNASLNSGRKYKQLYLVASRLMTTGAYNKYLSGVQVDSETTLISHAPSLEAIFLCKELKKRFSFVKYIQYWSDPYSLAGILPENFGFKRYPSFIIENNLLKDADRIVYCSEILMRYQKKLFPRYAEKMDYTYVSYSPDNIMSSHQNNRLVFGYSGNYMEGTRNIKPLYEAFKVYKKADLWIYGKGTPQLFSDDYIFVQSRCPQYEIAEIESKMDIYVGLLNHSCVQIPGKIYYQINTNKVILIILDGKYAREIRDHLEPLNRFVFCENNVESILEAVDKIYRGEYEVDLSCLSYTSPKEIAGQICQ